MKRSLIQIVSVVLIVALMATMVGCYGSFSLVNKVHKFNGTLGNKFVNELGFLVMMIVPVYSVAGFIDAVVLNTIEFWTGRNPMMTENGTQRVILPEGELVFRNSEGTYELKQVINGVESVVRIESRDGVVVAKDGNGTVLAKTVRNADGGVTILDASGIVLSTLSKAQVESMIATR